MLTESCHKEQVLVSALRVADYVAGRATKNTVCIVAFQHAAELGCLAKLRAVVRWRLSLQRATDRAEEQVEHWPKQRQI